MTLLFDISVLGYGAIQPAFRTGVFRATEELALALSQEMSDELIFCAGDSAQAWALSYSFWKNHPLNVKPFSPAGDKKLLYTEAVNHLTRLNQIEKPHFPQKILRRCLRELASLREPHTQDLFPCLNQGIYHSPFYPFLPQTKPFKRVLSVYDLINLTHPEVTSGSADFFKTLLSSITEDDNVICSSEWTRQELLGRCPALPPDQVSTIHLGLSQRFRPASSEAIHSIKTLYQLERPYFLALSTMEKRKNFPFLLDCFQDFLKSQPQAEVDLVLVGASSNTHEMIRNSIEPKFSKRIQRLGFVPEEHLPALYTGALCFVFPSLFEGFGFPPLEAMGCGCPVLSSKGSSLDEVVGEGGKLLSPYSKQDWIEAFTLIYDSSKEREHLREKGLAWVKRFSWQETARKHVALYKSLSSFT